VNRSRTSSDPIPGDLFVLSAPSGCGKTSVIRGVLESIDSVAFSVSTTTRSPRPGEHDGIDYHFVEVETFHAMAEKGLFLEWAEVHNNLYGTSAETVDKARQAGTDIILDIDVQGSRQVKDRCPESIHILLLPPSFEELRSRLLNRLSDSESEIETRLRNAGGELMQSAHYDYVMINEDLTRAVEDLKTIIRARRLCRERMAGKIQAVLDTFLPTKEAP